MSVYATGSNVGWARWSQDKEHVHPCHVEAGGDVLRNAAWNDSECTDSKAEPRKLFADSLAAERAYLGQGRACARWPQKGKLGVSFSSASLRQTETLRVGLLNITQVPAAESTASANASLCWCAPALTSQASLLLTWIAPAATFVRTLPKSKSYSGDSGDSAFWPSTAPVRPRADPPLW